MRAVWLQNLKKFVTGTAVSSKNGMDVNVINVSLPTSFSETAHKEYRFQDAADTNIPGSGSAMVQIGDSLRLAANITNTITKLCIMNNTGSALTIGVGADATAAAANIVGVAHAGQTSEAVFGVALSSGNKIWVRNIVAAASTSGELMVALKG